MSRCGRSGNLCGCVMAFAGGLWASCLFSSGICVFLLGLIAFLCGISLLRCC